MIQRGDAQQKIIETLMIKSNIITHNTQKHKNINKKSIPNIIKAHTFNSSL
jgi:hypothetical protein